MLSPSTSVLLEWGRREPVLKAHLDAMTDSSLVTFARCLWWEAIQRGEPFGFLDDHELAVAREACARRGLADRFEAAEREIRDELSRKGLLPAQREAARQRAV